MALAFMLNPKKSRKKARRKARRRAGGRSSWGACMRAAGGKPRAASRMYRAGVKCGRVTKLRRRAMKRRAKRPGIIVGQSPSDIGRGVGYFGLNPRKRRGRKGGRKMAAKTKRRRRGWSKAKRASAGRKAWRTRLRRYPKYKSSKKRRGYRNASRLRRNTWRDDRAGHSKAAKKGWRRKRRASRKSNPQRRRRNARRGRRRNSMYSRSLYANPRRRRRNARRGRRRNPLAIGGTLSSITKKLTDPGALMQFAVAGAGASVSEMLGSFLSAKIKKYAETTFADPTSMASKFLDALARIAVGLLIGSFLPAKYQTAWVLGSGAMAAQPLVSGLLKPVLDPIGAALSLQGIHGLRGGVGGWISAGEVYGPRQLRGMGSWVTAQQMPGVGVQGMRGLGYAFQPGMQSAFTM